MAQLRPHLAPSQPVRGGARIHPRRCPTGTSTAIRFLQISESLRNCTRLRRIKNTDFAHRRKLCPNSETLHFRSAIMPSQVMPSMIAFPNHLIFLLFRSMRCMQTANEGSKVPTAGERSARRDEVIDGPCRDRATRMVTWPDGRSQAIPIRVETPAISPQSRGRGMPFRVIVFVQAITPAPRSVGRGSIVERISMYSTLFDVNPTSQKGPHKPGLPPRRCATTRAR